MKKSFYKGYDFLKNSYMDRMNNYFNPFECNLGSTKKDDDATRMEDEKFMKSKCQFNRQISKK